MRWRNAFNNRLNANFIRLLFDRFNHVDFNGTLNHFEAERQWFGVIQFVVFEALNGVVRRFHVQIRNQYNVDFET